jgi:hypothetical protein
MEPHKPLLNFVIADFITESAGEPLSWWNLAKYAGDSRFTLSSICL